MAKVQAPNFDPSRLPAYRSSFLERFHPYARAASRHAQDRLMNTVDYRDQQRPIVEEPVPETCAPETRCEEISEHDTSPAECDLPVAGGEQDEDVPVDQRLGRSKLTVALSALMETLRLKYLTKEAVRDFLKPERAEQK